MQTTCFYKQFEGVGATIQTKCEVLVIAFPAIWARPTPAREACTLDVGEYAHLALLARVWHLGCECACWQEGVFLNGKGDCNVGT